MTITRAIYDGPPNGYKANRGPKKYVALHNTSNDGSARDEISYAKWREDLTSTHYYGDPVEVLQSLDTYLCANHAGSTEGNSYAISWEFTGTNGKSRAWWLANLCWPLIARQMAADCREWGIPPRLLTVAEMRGGVAKGFVTHDLMRLAWGGTTHTDPGAGFPVDYLLALVAAELEGDMAFKDDDDARALMYRLDAVFKNKPKAEWTQVNGVKRSEVNGLYVAQVAQDAALAEVARLTGLDPAELDAVKAAAREGALAGAEAALTPEALADAIPDELAADVVRLLAERSAAALRAAADVVDPTPV